MEIESEKTDKEIATEVKEIKMKAELATEDLIDDETEEGDSEDQDFSFDQDDEDDSIIHADEVMSLCEEKINLCEDKELKDFFVGIKKFYDGASCDETKKKIALQVNNKVFKLNQ